MNKPTTYLAFFVAYISISVLTLILILSDDVFRSSIGLFHFTLTIAYFGYVYTYQRNRKQQGLPTKGWALFR